MKILYENKKDSLDILNKSKDRIEKKKINKINKKENLFILGENFDILSNLIEIYKGKIDLIYIDPPYNTKNDFMYSADKISNVSYTKDSVVAYEDKMNLETYLEFIRERMILLKELLSEKGTLYIHIDDKVGHYLKLIIDEIFGKENFLKDITRIKSNPKNFKRKTYGNQKDVIYMYSKNNGKNIFNNITKKINNEDKIIKKFPKIDDNGRRYTTVPCHAPGETKNGETGKEWRGILPPTGRHWRCSVNELEKLDLEGKIEWSKNKVPRIKKYSDEHKGEKIQDVWDNYKDPQYPIYPTEKNINMLEMIILQSSNENSIIMDCFCGSGNFLKAGIKNKRQVIGIDKSIISKNVVETNVKNIKILDW